MNILLICSAGMSTSMVVKKMQAEAEAKGLDAKIWAVGTAAAKADAPTADVILLGPQIRFMEKQIKADYNKPTMVIDMMDYGRLDGVKILEKALALLG